MIKQIVSYALAVASRGLKNKKTDIIAKQLRYISCFGFSEIGPCQFLTKSNKSDFYYCGKCGCGDSSGTWLIKQPGQYSKLDYPSLNCPLKMPGFTNYDPNFYNEDNRERKNCIENMPAEKIQLIQITVNESEEVNRLSELVDKVKKNT